MLARIFAGWVLLFQLCPAFAWFPHGAGFASFPLQPNNGGCGAGNTGGCAWFVSTSLGGGGSCTGQTTLTPPANGQLCPDIATAFTKLRTGHGDQVRLLCTDTFTDAAPSIRFLSGASTTYPMVLATYGTGCTDRARWKLLAGQAIFNQSGGSLWAFQSFECNYYTRNPADAGFDPTTLFNGGACFNLQGLNNWYFVQDVKISYGTGLDIAGTNPTGSSPVPIATVTYDRNVAVDAYAVNDPDNSPNAKAQGVHTDYILNLTLTGNVADSNGYNATLTTPSTAAISIASSAIITWNDNNYYRAFFDGSSTTGGGEAMFVDNGDTLPSPFVKGTQYYMRNVNGTNQFSLTDKFFTMNITTTANSTAATVANASNLANGFEIVQVGSAGNFTGSIGSSFTGTAGTPTTQLAITGTGFPATRIKTGDVLIGGSGAGTTTITGFVSGTNGGDGTYTLSQANTNTGAMTTNSTWLNVSAMATAALGNRIDQFLFVGGSGVAANTKTTNIPAGTAFPGTTGFYALTGAAQNVPSESMTIGGLFYGLNPTITVSGNNLTLSTPATVSATFSANFVGNPISTVGGSQSGTHLLSWLDPGKNQFNHGMYLGADFNAAGNPPAIVTGNISTRNSLDGIQQRMGGTQSNNFLVGNNGNNCGGWALCIQNNNVIAESTANGAAIELTAPGNTVDGNIIYQTTSAVNFAIVLDTGATSNVTNSVVCGMSGGIGNTNTNGITNNSGGAQPGGNNLSPGNDPTAACTGIPGSANPTRTVETYDSAVLGGPGTLADFIACAVANNQYKFNPACTADAVNRYIRAGFGR